MFVRSWFHFTIIFVSLHSVAISSTIPTITKVETTVLQVRDEVIITRDPITLPHATITNEPITLNLPPKCVQTDIPDSNGFVPVGTCGSNYNYYPSFGAAVAASILFGIVTVVHIVQAASYKKRFCWVLIMGAIWETGAFVIRSISTRNQQSDGLALASQLLVLLSPIWVNAFVYTVLARMVYFYLPSHSLLGVSASTLASLFVFLDIISFIVQLIGGGMAGKNSPQEQIDNGLHLYMAGIGLQEFFIVIFVGFSIKFHQLLLRMELNGQLHLIGKGNWRRLLYTVYASLLLITARIIFRLVEFSAGTSTSNPNNPLLLNEAYLYALDSVPMFLAILVFAVTHPGMSLTGPDSVIPKAAWRLRWADKRRRNKMAKKQGKWVGLKNDDDTELINAPSRQHRLEQLAR